MIRPRRLRPGDRLAVVAPASGFKAADLDAGIAELRRLGFEAVFDPQITARERFEAGPPPLRARLLEDAWGERDVAGVIAVRGGYGSQQLLPLLQPEVMREAAKPFIGYSDVTALHAWHLRHGMVSIYGPMLEGRLAAGPERYDADTFLRTIGEPEPLGELKPPGVEVLVPGEAAGLVLGGTLAQVVALLGTPWTLDVPRGAILLLEDIGERPYRVHRMLTQLAQSGALARAGALVFGEFPGCDEPGGDPAVRDVLRDFVRGFPGPVLFGFPFGHARGALWTVPLGVQGRVTTGPPALVITEPAVA